VRAHLEIVAGGDLRSMNLLTDVETVLKYNFCLFPTGCFAIPGYFLIERSRPCTCSSVFPSTFRHSRRQANL